MLQTINQKKFFVFFSTLDEKNLSNTKLLSTIYDENCIFKDPFNNTNNIIHIQRIYLHSYKHFKHVRFILDDIFWKEQHAILVWRFELNKLPLNMSQKPKFDIKGTSLLTFQNELIISHEDFWDPIAGLWSKIPIICILMRFLNRNLKID